MRFTRVLDYTKDVKPSKTQIERQWALKGSMWHRRFVGAKDNERWQAMGLAQMQLLREHGMDHRSRLLDVGCGSLRLGVHAIPWLMPHHYIGVDISERLVRTGIKRELSRVRGWQFHKPRFVITDCFDLEDIERVDYAIAQSVFTHLGTRSIERCLQSVMPKVGGCFLASFNRGNDEPVADPVYPDMSTFSIASFERLARRVGCQCTYIGGWGIPQNKRGHQLMLRFER